MMKRNQKAWLAAGLLAGAAALTGCSASTTPAATPTPDTAQQVTAQPEAAETTASPSGSPEAGEETPGPTALRVGDEEIDAGAVIEEGRILLPLEATAQALGWEAHSEEQEEETQVRRSVTLDKDESRISVAWVVSDNTARQITWQKDGLLIPVDTEITSFGGVTYVPAAFFETAMRVRVEHRQGAVWVSQPEETATPDNAAQQESDAQGAS